jgi:hypothetical protein
MAWAIVWLAARWLGGPIGEVAELYGLAFTLQPLDGNATLGLFAIAAALGWGGAALSLRQHLETD